MMVFMNIIAHSIIEWILKNSIAIRKIVSSSEAETTLECNDDEPIGVKNE